jgi:hypothetical protein
VRRGSKTAEHDVQAQLWRAAAGKRRQLGVSCSPAPALGFSRRILAGLDCSPRPSLSGVYPRDLCQVYSHGIVMLFSMWKK